MLQAPTGGATLGLTDIAALTITPAPPPTTLTVTPAAGTYGATANFSATLTAAGAPVAGEPVTFTVTADGRTSTLGTATTGANGVASLSGVSLGSLSAGTYPGAVSASFGGDASGSTSTGSGDLSIAQATPTVTWAMPADITQGQALGAAQLDASASVPGTFAYSPPAGKVLPAGMGQTLTAVFTPADATDYKGVNVSTTINVRPTSSQTPTTLDGRAGRRDLRDDRHLSATLTAAGTPLAGESVTFTVVAGGRTTTLRHGDDRRRRQGVTERREPRLVVGGDLLRRRIGHLRRRRQRRGHGRQRRPVNRPGYPHGHLGRAGGHHTKPGPGAAQLDATPRCRAHSSTRRPPGRSCPRAWPDLDRGVRSH